MPREGPISTMTARYCLRPIPKDGGVAATSTKWTMTYTYNGPQQVESNILKVLQTWRRGAKNQPHTAGLYLGHQLDHEIGAHSPTRRVAPMLETKPPHGEALGSRDKVRQDQQPSNEYQAYRETGGHIAPI